MTAITVTTAGYREVHPLGRRPLRAGDTLVVLGTREQISRLERLMKGDEVEDNS